MKASTQQLRQASHTAAEESAGAGDAAHGGFDVRSPYLTSREALVYLRLNSLSSLYRHIRENRLPVLRAGGDLRFDRRELDAWLRGTTAIELTRGARSHDRKSRAVSASTVSPIFRQSGS